MAKGEIPPPTTRIIDPFTRAHRLLLLTFGLAWRIFGISHTVTKAVLLLFFIWTAVVIYALCRLAMRPVLAAAISLLYLISCLQFLICVSAPRDFCKAPLALTIVFLVALLIARRSSPRRFLLLAAVLGIAGGFATGFRQDLFIYLPPAVGAILCCRLAATFKQTILLKGIAVALFLLGLIPFSQSTVKASSDDVFTFHYLVMGWSRRCDDSLGIRQASYTVLDNYVDLYAAVAYQRYGALLDNAGKPPLNQT